MKAKRQHQQAVAQQIVIGQVYDGDKLDALRKAISKDANKLLTTAIEDRIDVFNDPIDKLQYLSRQVGIFFKIISIGPRPQKDIEKAIVILCSMTPKTAASHVKKIKCLFLNAGRIVEKDGKIQLA